MSREKYCPVAPAFAAQLVEQNLVGYYPQQSCAMWFGEFLSFSPACQRCWEVLWTNFLRGNLPIKQDTVKGGYSWTLRHIADIFKRHRAWKRIIVGDGKGRYWLLVPDEFMPPARPDPGFGPASPPPIQPLPAFDGSNSNGQPTEV